MILHSLVALRTNIAELQGDDAFEDKRVDFIIVVDASGSVVGLESLRGADGRGLLSKVPRMPKRASGIAPSFLVDNAKYVLGVESPDGKPDKKLEQKRTAFVDRIREFPVADDVGLNAVRLAYENWESNRERLFALRAAQEWSGSELVAFRFSDETGPVHLRPNVVAAWSREQHGDLEPIESADHASQPARQTRCLVTGAVGKAARLHPSIKRVPGSQSSGASLVAFNARAFESHGLVQGENAPVSQHAVNAYGDVLNWMLSEDPTLGKARPYRYGVRIGDETVVVFWANQSRPAMDAFALFANLPSTPHEAIAAVESAWKGFESVADEEAFYALTLGGNAARIVIRAWFSTTMRSLKAGLRRYFDDLALATTHDVTGPAPVPIRLLLRSLTPPGNGKLAPDLETRLFRASIDPHGAIPREILRLALRRLAIPPDGDLRDRKSPSEMLHARCALIKASLLAIARRELHPERKRELEVQMALDPENKSPGYVLGRLFAVLERLQSAALGDLNATIRDRYFGGASTSPASVMGRLLSLSTKHLTKLGGGLEHYFDERLRNVIRMLDGNRMPGHLGLEDQGLFAIGYFHEKDWLIGDARARGEKKKNDETKLVAKPIDLTGSAS